MLAATKLLALMLGVAAAADLAHLRGAGRALQFGHHAVEDDCDSGEDICENHGFAEDECESIGCCFFDEEDSACMSAVGDGCCTATEEEDEEEEDEEEDDDCDCDCEYAEMGDTLCNYEEHPCYSEVCQHL